MPPIAPDLARWIDAATARAATLEPTVEIENVGSVAHVGDGVARVTGLPGTRLDELLRFADGSLGIALVVEADAVDCALISRSASGGDGFGAGSRVHGTGDVVRVPVGPALLGRVVDPLGRPLDEGPPIAAARHDPVERPAPGIVERELVTEPLMTGVTVVDAMVPLGRGQRELIIGDRKTGKTAMAVDAIVAQRDTDVVCVYAAIGQKTTAVRQVIEAVRRHGPFERSIFVVGAADAPPGSQWITAYAACTMAEYFRDQGRHALIVYDDLTKHAVAYRQLALLLRRPPAREAYPGDIFYVQARLLERAAKLADDRGGGSLTALPVAETQQGNLSAYIPTNLISITDGQIYFESRLFHEGQRPAVNVGLSVSRVGGQTQAPAMSALARPLRLAYAQFLELEVFTRLGGVTDERTMRTIERGRRIRAILGQPQYAALSLATQCALLLAVGEGKLDRLDLDATDRFRDGIGAWVAETVPRSVAAITASGTLSDDDRADLLAAIDRLVERLRPPEPSEPAQTGDPPAGEPAP